MSADPYRWPDSTDILGQLRDAEARIARVQALMDTHATKDGRVPICQLRTAIGGALSGPVVIDPEDREQVERLIRSMDVEFDGFPRETVTDADYTDMQAALRSLIAPLKPEEPTGLGAVVEDAKGRLWLRTEPDEGERVYFKPWASGPIRCNWQIVAAVRVLSEGVTE